MKQKVFFMIPSLAGGGAERVFVNLVKNIDKSIFDVTLICLSNQRNVYELPSEIKQINLNCKRTRNAVFKIIKLIRREKPDLIISTIGQLNLTLLLLKKFFPNKTKVIVRQTFIPSMKKSSNPFKRIMQKIILSNYSKADKVICQSEYMEEDFIKVSGIDSSKVVKIYNPVDLKNIRLKSKEKIEYEINKEYKNIFYAGRLDEVKRIPLIIDAFRQYNDINPKSKLYLIGEGPEIDNLNMNIHKNNLHEKVVLLGFQSNPYKWLSHADLFIMASKHEGLPNVLIEALALEIPVLILKHPGGTGDIMKRLEIEDRFVENLIIKEEFFENYNHDISINLDLYFGVENIVKKYEELFLKII